MEYNETSKELELTLSVTTDDFEHYLRAEGLSVTSLELDLKGELFLGTVTNELLDGFQVKQSQGTVIFDLIGFEVTNKGVSNFYFKSRKIEKADYYSISFDLMMDYNPEQQNKLTLIYKHHSTGVSFLYDQRNKNIMLENN